MANSYIHTITSRCIAFKHCANTTGENNNGTSDVALGLFKQKKEGDLSRPRNTSIWLVFDVRVSDERTVAALTGLPRVSTQ